MPATFQDVKKELVAMAATFDVPITAAKVQWYMRFFEGRNPDDVLKALYRYGMTTKIRRLPLPGDLLEEMPGEVVAGNIIMAIGKYGYINPGEAKEFLGDAWRVVEMMGGWADLCERKMERGTFIAQVRDLWTALQRSDNGHTTRSILEQGSKDRGLLDMDRSEERERIRTLEDRLKGLVESPIKLRDT